MSLDQALAAWAIARERGVPFRFRGVGRSMWPLLRPGDVALVAAIADGDGDPVREGEVVLVRVGEGLLAHRVIGRHEDGRLRLRGDFTLAEDPPVQVSAVLGRLTGVERAGRYVALDGLTGRALESAMPVLQRRAPRAINPLRRAIVGAARLWRLVRSR